MTEHGFDLVREEYVSELDTNAALFRHRLTGADLLSLENSDENKVFCISVRTPPPDSTGVAHILEHAVLGGSQKYPLKEPFVQLVKGSLKTFLNALTYPDRTVYPVASQNLQDFYNLIDVYVDAVFHPLITPEHLKQEGWHYELEAADAPLTYKGVVFNEMKGVYSSPDSLLYRASQRSLFPDNAYGFDSGGDPQVIPRLTYQQFRSFHAKYYHPRNTLICFHGDDPVEERLRRMNAALAGFGPATADGHVGLQTPFTEPRRFIRGFDADDDGAASKRGMIQLRWLLPESSDVELVMGLSLLSHALVGTQASPLRKRLIDSGLGEDLTGGGLSASLRQMTFAVGLKGIDPQAADEVEALILSTLEELGRDGIESDMVEASYNTIEFGLRENNTGSYPRGLNLIMRALHGWLYSDDPIGSLGYETTLAAVRRRLDLEPDYLPGMIRRYLVDNTHRTTVILRPEAGLNQQQEEAERRELKGVRRALSEQDLARIIEDTRELRRLQERVDTAEELALLPSLALSDLDERVKTIALEIDDAGDCPVYYHDLFTSSIIYLDLGFDLHTVPAELLAYAKLFGQCLVQMGTESEDYVKLSQRIGRLTGGIYPSTFVSARRDDDAGVARLFLRSKATVARAPDMADILRDVLLTVRLDNRERFRQIVLRAKAGLESNLIPGGSSIVDGRLRAAYNQSDWAAEQMSGISYLQTLRTLAQEIDQDWPAVLDRLEAVRSILVNRRAMICNVTVDAAAWREFEPVLATLVSSLPQQDVSLAEWPGSVDASNEGLIAPSKVNYVGKGAGLYEVGYRAHGSIGVITNYLRTSYLWDKVRAQGGAYGAYCRFGRQSGILTFLSYRDPNLLATLNVYDQAAEFLRDARLTEDELVRNIIGAIGTLDAHQLPDAKGFTSMARALLGESDERRQQYRNEALATSAADVRAFADVLDAAFSTARVVVLGGEEAVQAAAANGADLPSIQRIL